MIFFQKIERDFHLKLKPLTIQLHITVELPCELEFQFEGIDQTLIKHDEKQWFERNKNLYYLFPNEKVTGTSKSTGAVLYDLGNKMQIKFINTAKTGVVYFNPSIGSYQVTYINN